MRRSCASVAAVAAMLILVPPLRAQGEGAPLTITLGGAGAVAVEAATPGGRTALGTVRAGQPLSVLASALNLGKGKRVEVVEDRTGPEPKLVLTPAGQVDPTCEEAQRSREDACRVVGAFPWGEVASLAATSGAAGLGVSVFGVRPTPRFVVGAGGRYATYGKAEEVGCDQVGITGCIADDSKLGLSVTAEYWATPKMVVGARYFTGGYAITQEYGTTEQLVDVSLHGYEGYLQFRPLQAGPINPFIGGGWGWWCNQADLVLDGTAIGTRGESGGRIFGELGADVRFGTSPFGLRLNAGFGSGGGGDADTQRYLGFHFTYGF